MSAHANTARSGWQPHRRLEWLERIAALLLLLLAGGLASRAFEASRASSSGGTSYLGWRVLLGAIVVWILPGYVLARRWLDRADTLAELAAQKPHPDPGQWRQSYPRIVAGFNPPSDLPFEVVETIAARVPPGQVFLYDPRAIYTIPALLNQYVAHAGFPLSTEENYFARWVHEGVHPMFNEKPFLAWARESVDFLEAYRVDYVLINPAYQGSLPTRIVRLNRVAQRPVFSRVFHSSGFSLERVEREALPEARAGLTRLRR